jgi:hypothetical protein
MLSLKNQIRGAHSTAGYRALTIAPGPYFSYFLTHRNRTMFHRYVQ